MPPLYVQYKYTNYMESAIYTLQHVHVAYAGMVILGVTEVNLGSFLKVNSTPVPVTFALSMCTTIEPVEGRDEMLPV